MKENAMEKKQKDAQQMRNNSEAAKMQEQELHQHIVIQIMKVDNNRNKVLGKINTQMLRERQIFHLQTRTRMLNEKLGRGREIQPETLLLSNTRIQVKQNITTVSCTIQIKNILRIITIRLR